MFRLEEPNEPQRTKKKNKKHVYTVSSLGTKPDVRLYGGMWPYLVHPLQFVILRFGTFL